MPLLPANPDQAAFDTTFNLRGVAILECDGKRDLAVQTFTREHEAEAEWKRQRDARRSWSCRWFKIACS